MSEFQTDITLRVVSNFDIVFECTFCLYLQIIITFCLIKHDIYDRNIILDLRTFSVYGHGACTLIQMHLI